MNPRQLTFVREYRGYSQTELSSKVKGLSQSNLSKFEKGVGQLSDEVKQLAKMINATLEPMREKRKYYDENPEEVDKVLDRGTKEAREKAKEAEQTENKQ